MYLNRPCYRRHALVTAVAFCLLATSITAQAAKRIRPITKPKFDPEAERVELFTGIEKGTLDVKVIPKDEMGGNVLVTNLTDKPLTVDLPDAFVGVQVLKQFGGMGGGMGGGGMGGGMMGGGGMGGGQQSLGGGMGGGGMGGGGMGGGGMMGGGGGGNFFSVPPEKIVSVPYTSVCLEHGKATPSSRSTYRMVRVEEYTKNEQLRQVIRMVGTGRLDKQSAQAAAWYYSDSMSWQELASKKVKRTGRAPLPYFSTAQLYRAQAIAAHANALAREVAKNRPANAPSDDKADSRAIRSIR